MSRATSDQKNAERNAGLADSGFARQGGFESRVVLACTKTSSKGLCLQCYPGRRKLWFLIFLGRKTRNKGTFAKTALLQNRPCVSSRPARSREPCYHCCEAGNRSLVLEFSAETIRGLKTSVFFWWGGGLEAQLTRSKHWCRNHCHVAWWEFRLLKKIFGPPPTPLVGATLSGLPNANAKSQRFSYAIPKSHPCTQFPKSHWPLSFSAPKSQRFKSQRLQDANATKSQTLAFYKSQRFSATKALPPNALKSSRLIWTNFWPPDLDN